MKRTRTNRHNVQWSFAKEAFNALRSGAPVPPVPEYTIWEKEEDSTKAEVIVGKKPIEPQPVSFGGKRLFG